MTRGRKWLIAGFLGVLGLALVFGAVGGRAASRPKSGVAAIFTRPTNSSPIAIAADNSLIWSVNPDDDSVSVISTASNTAIKKINVGKEPQSIALDPNNQFAYVANAAGNTMTVIKITNPNPAAFIAAVDTTVGQGGDITTGAEPWDIVISPDGKRVFVANSGQDTITVINALNRSVIGNVNLRTSTVCNGNTAALRQRHFQPRGLAVNLDSSRLYVTRFLSFVKSGGVQGNDNGKEGLVCRLNINTDSTNIADYAPAAAIPLAARVTGFQFDSNGDGTPDTDTSAYPNQLQSIVLRGDKAYLPNIASSPSRPLRFNVDTQAFVNRIDSIGGAESDGGAINLHLGAREPEAGKTKLFFANPWAIAFTNQNGVGNAYVVSAGSDLLVKLSVGADGALSNSVDANTTRYIDLNDPAAGANAGKNPLGITINEATQTAYVMNRISRNITVVNLATDSIAAVIKTTDLPPAGTLEEQIQVGAEMFFSSRGNFVRPGGTTISIQNRLSSDGWQNCASCHFEGLTDGTVWQFGSGPRKSVPMNGTWNPNNPDDQRVLNYSAIFDEVQDFEANVRNVSGPGALATAQACSDPAPGAAATSTFDPNHGLLLGDTNPNLAPCAIPALAGRANAGRPQLKVKLPGSNSEISALDALKEWVRFGIRTPNRPLTTVELSAGGGNPAGGSVPADIAAGRTLFFQAGCQTCHGGGKWTNSVKDFESPPAAAEIATEADPNAAGTFPDPNTTPYLQRFLENIKSYNLNVPAGGNAIPGQPQIGAIEKDAAGKDALGKDFDGNGKGEGFNTPSLLASFAVPPYYHNGACETLDCVLNNINHRKAGLRPNRSDPLTTDAARAQVARFLESIDANTLPPANLRLNRHDIFLDPPTAIVGTTVQVGANISLFGAKVPTFSPGPLKVTFYDGIPGAAGTTVIGEADLSGIPQDFGTVTVKVPWNVPITTGIRRIVVVVDQTDLFVEDNENDNSATRLVAVRPVPPDRTPPTISNVQINNGQAITSSRDVTVSFTAIDPPSPGGATTAGLGSFCAVTYYFDAVQHRWVEQNCTFAPLPAPSGTTFTVNARIAPRAGTGYVFVWVKDLAGNISRTPGFDFISFVNGDAITLNRNDRRIFRITLGAGQTAQMTFTPSLGDVDVSAFKDLTNLTRCAVSASNGILPETVTLGAGDCGGATTFQVEVRAIENSTFRVSVTQTLTGLLRTDLQAVGPQKEAPLTPFTSGPPALQTAIDEPVLNFLPVTRR